MLKKGAERDFFIRGFAAGVVMLSSLSLASSYALGSGPWTYQGIDLSHLDGEEKATPAGEAASILDQALVLSDAMMNREIERGDIPGIVNGALRSLDPYSGYVDRETTDLVNKGGRVSEEFMLGFLGAVEDSGYVIRSTVPKSPADGSGVLAGDRIVQINDTDVAAMTGQEALDVLKSLTQESAGRAMRLGFDRKGDLLTFEISPEKIPESFAYDLGMSNGILHLKIAGFFKGVSGDVERIIARSANNGGLAGIVFDLRGNSGGLTDETQEIAELVMPKGTLLYREAGLHIGEIVVSTTRHPKFKGIDLAVLVDGDSASASEIFASAVQANDLGPVIGGITYGKGTIQNVYPFSDGRGAIRITIGEYKDADDRTINGIGVIPDIIVAPDEGEEGDVALDAALRALGVSNG